MSNEVIYSFVFGRDGEDAIELNFLDSFDHVLCEGFGRLVEVALREGAEG